MKAIEIEIAVDHEEAEEFAEFLNNNGYYAYVGSTTGKYVDGHWTNSSDEANILLNQLWSEYCRS